MSTPIQSEMLRLFESGATSYQPAGLIFESGDPLVADANLKRLLGQGFVIADILVRPTGTLFIFSCGVQYYTPALRVGGNGPTTEKLAEFAAKAGFGDETELLMLYHDLPADFRGQLPNAGPMPGDEDDIDPAHPNGHPDGTTAGTPILPMLRDRTCKMPQSQGQPKRC